MVAKGRNLIEVISQLNSSRMSVSHTNSILLILV